MTKLEAFIVAFCFFIAGVFGGYAYGNAKPCPPTVLATPYEASPRP